VAHLWDGHRACRRRVEDLLVGGGWRLSGDQGFGDPVDRLPQHARPTQTGLAGGDAGIDHSRLDIPAGKVLGAAQPLEVALPALADGGAKGEAEPPGPEDEPKLLGWRWWVAVRSCVPLHVTSITCDVSGDGATTVDRRRVEELLIARGADRLAHPGGTLYEHLRRVASLLQRWGADRAVQAAGLCHACYGTDGYDQALLEVTNRATLVSLIGSRAESPVYLYGSCDRRAVYPGLAGFGPVPFRDRFTTRTVVPTEQQLRDFLEITAANELDVVRHNPAMAAEHGADLLQLFTRVRDRLSDAAWRDCVDVLGEHGPGRHAATASAVEISGLDHIVLTVTDLDRTLDFYQRVVGMRAVTFGSGRHALAFGTSKINLHQAGREHPPHAAAPTPGSADICLTTTTPLDQVLAHLEAHSVAVEEGPVPRTGALGPHDKPLRPRPRRQPHRDRQLPHSTSFAVTSAHLRRTRHGTQLLRQGGGLGVPRHQAPTPRRPRRMAGYGRPASLAPRPGMRLLDLGAGTGMWAAAFSGWYGIDVVAVEPSRAMRARSSYPGMLDGDAAAIPLDAAAVDAAWLSTVIHHFPDLPAAAAELWRVLRPGGRVLIRSAFPGRHQPITLFRFFPEAIRVLDTYPSVTDARAAFAATGFEHLALEPVRQITADSLVTAAANLRRDAHTPLRLLTDAEYERGLARLRAAADTETGPVIDTLDLLVLRRR